MFASSDTCTLCCCKYMPHSTSCRTPDREGPQQLDSNGAAWSLCHIVVLQHKLVAQQKLLGRLGRATPLFLAGALINMSLYCVSIPELLSSAQLVRNVAETSVQTGLQVEDMTPFHPMVFAVWKVKTSRQPIPALQGKARRQNVQRLRSPCKLHDFSPQRILWMI